MGAVQGRNTREILLDGSHEEVQTADFPAVQDGVHLGPHFLNRAKIRVIGQKIQHFHPLCLQNFPDGFYMMRISNYPLSRDNSCLCSKCKTGCNVKSRAENLVILSQVHRLCVYASGSLMTATSCCCTEISVSCLHLGQYSGKFSNTVSSRILSWVLFLQTGHSIHFLTSWCTSCF